MIKQNCTKIIISLLLLLTIGCSFTGDVTFTATIDGKEFKAVVGFWDDDLVEGFGQIFTIDRDGNTFTILIAGSIEEKTYSIGPIEQMAECSVLYMDAAQGIAYASQSGTLTITSKTERLAGTFEMSLVGMGETGEEVILGVTDGIFDLPGSPLM